ncbi:MAG: TIGR03067 domain-containing protein [Planctomycetales bacterium]|nr:TIGR03067 domain-containing protein [Planctomycetales bacterium]
MRGVPSGFYDSDMSFVPVRSLWPRTLPVLLVAAGVVAEVPRLAADSGGREKIPGDLILMQGAWKLVDFVYYRDGVAQRPPRQQMQGTRTVTGNRYRLQLTIGGQRVDNTYTFQLYPNQQPKAMDVTLPDKRVIQGIYHVEGDTLRRCYSQPDEPRPTKFQAGNQTYQEWRRVVEVPRPAES